MTFEFCLMMFCVMVFVLVVLSASSEVLRVTKIRACWILASAIMSLGLFVYGNFVVVMLALVIPAFFELLYPNI